LSDKHTSLKKIATNQFIYRIDKLIYATDYADYTDKY